MLTALQILTMVVAIIAIFRDIWIEKFRIGKKEKELFDQYFRDEYIARVKTKLDRFDSLVLELAHYQLDKVLEITAGRESTRAEDKYLPFTESMTIWSGVAIYIDGLLEFDGKFSEAYFKLGLVFFKHKEKFGEEEINEWADVLLDFIVILEEAYKKLYLSALDVRKRFG